MKPRLDYGKAAPGVYDAMDGLDQYLSKCGLEESLLHLVRLRAWTHFTEKEMADLTLALAAINAWNRLSIAGRLVPGAYQPAAAAR